MKAGKVSALVARIVRLRLEVTAPDRLALGAFAGAILIGGSNFVAVVYSNRELDPLGAPAYGSPWRRQSSACWYRRCGYRSRAGECSA